MLTAKGEGARDNWQSWWQLSWIGESLLIMQTHLGTFAVPLSFRRGRQSHICSSRSKQRWCCNNGVVYKCSIVNHSLWGSAVPDSALWEPLPGVSREDQDQPRVHPRLQHGVRVPAGPARRRAGSHAAAEGRICHLSGWRMDPLRGCLSPGNKRRENAGSAVQELHFRSLTLTSAFYHTC